VLFCLFVVSHLGWVLRRHCKLVLQPSYPGAQCAEELQGTYPEDKNKPIKRSQKWNQKLYKLSHGATRPLQL